MTHYYEKLAEFKRIGYDIIVDKTYCDLTPRHSFEDCDVEQLCKDIDSGIYDWFMLRVRVLVEGHELAAEYLTGCLYEDAREVLTDGLAEEQIHLAMTAAKKEVTRLSRVLWALQMEMDQIAMEYEHAQE